MSENLDEIVNGNNSFLMSNNKIPIIINNPTGAPYDFHKEVVPQFLNYLRNYPQKPGNFSQDPSLADFFKHLRETATEMQKNGDEAVQPLIPEKVPSKMIKLNERTSKKVGVLIFL
ncbi:20097_t:CDS:2 [Rhizophagus irregularis]|nr:20097_t:CDS:2 [Rhizophagus irregularis]